MWRATTRQLQLVRSGSTNALVAAVVSRPHTSLSPSPLSSTGVIAKTESSRIVTALLALVDPQRARRRTTFFKSAYSRNDTFLGVTKPECRAVVRAHIHDTTRAEVSALLQDRRHEVRIAGGICLVEAFAAPLKHGQWLQDSDGSKCAIEGSEDGTGAFVSPTALELKQRVVDMYLEHLASFDNWDLVDLTSYKILGAWMVQHERHAASIEQFCALVDASASVETVDVAAEMAQLTSAMHVLPEWYQKLLVSSDFWETRVSIVLVYGVRTHSVAFALHIVRYQLLRLLDSDAYELRIKGERFDDYDLVHKACGWMLRECGRADRAALLQFLERYAPLTPRMSLQYATEHLAPELAKAIRSRGPRASKKSRAKTAKTAKVAAGMTAMVLGAAVSE